MTPCLKDIKVNELNYFKLLLMLCFPCLLQAVKY